MLKFNKNRFKNIMADLGYEIIYKDDDHSLDQPGFYVDNEYVLPLEEVFAPFVNTTQAENSDLVN